MKPINILNSKERKSLLKDLNAIFGVEALPEDLVYFYFEKKERLYVLRRSVFDIELEKLRINSMGLYFGTFMADGFRPSLEGLILLKDQLRKNVYPITLTQRDAWIEGNDLEVEGTAFEGQYVILKYQDELCGVGKVKNGSVMNYVPKSRKVKEVFKEE